LKNQGFIQDQYLGNFETVDIEQKNGFIMFSMKFSEGPTLILCRVFDILADLHGYPTRIMKG